MAENSIPIPHFKVRPNHVLSATWAQIFKYLHIMPSLGVSSPWSSQCTEVEFTYFFTSLFATEANIVNPLDEKWSNLTSVHEKITDL